MDADSKYNPVMPDDERIVLTKLLPPQVKGKILRRERLLETLRENLEKKLIIICADAGYGKTTLLAQLCHELPHPFVFYDLDVQDGAVHTFFRYLVASMRRHAPRFGARVSAVLAEKRDRETVCGTFINEFVEEIKGDFYIILDDFHRLRKDRKFAAMMDYLLRHLPANLHFIIASRTTPPLYLSYYLAKQELLHLDKEHLQFDVKETRALLHQVYGLVVPEVEITRITELSGGWATVIQLILQKISTTPGARAKETLNGYVASGEEVFEYFTREVFQNQPRKIREFLMKTSILEYLNSGICDRVLAIKGSAKIISHLETEHIFVLRAGQNILYHPLFQEFLQRRLTDQCAARDITRLHDAASGYLQGRGEYSAAVRHLLRAGRFERAAAVLERHYEYWFAAGEQTTFMQLLDKIPEALILKRPHLQLTRGSAYIEMMQLEKGLPDVNRALAQLRRRGDRPGMIKAYRLRFHASLHLMQAAQALANARRAIALIGARRSRDRTDVMIDLGTAYRIAGRFRIARSTLEAALKTARAKKDGRLEYRALHQLALVYYNVSAMKMAEKTLTDVVHRFHDLLCPLDQTSIYRMIASIAIENGDAARAKHYIERAEDTLRQFGDIFQENFLKLLRGRLSYLEGDHEKAIALLRQTIGKEPGVDTRITDLYASLDLVEVQLAAGDVRSARAALMRADALLKESTDIPQHTVGFLIGRGRVETAEGDPEAARRSLDQARRICKRVYDPMQHLAICYAMSEHALARGKIAEAYDSFKKCLSIASQHGFETYLMLQGRRNLRLFNLALEREYMPDFVLKLMTLIATDEAQETVRRVGLDQGRYDLDCRYLGGLEVHDPHGRQFAPHWRTSRTKAIFVLLTANHPRGCTRETLVDACWPGKTLERSVHSLQVEISSLRQLLHGMVTGFRPANLIICRDRNYSLNPRLSIRRDVTQFERTAHEAMASEAVDPARCKQQGAEALKLYRGDFCPEIGDDWCENLRAYYREMYFALLKKMAKCVFEDGDARQALALYQNAYRLDPYDEALHVGIMRCLARLNDRDGIQRQYRALTKVLKDLKIAAPCREATTIYEESLR